MTRKDIFIDNNIAKNFANPADAEYKKLIEWLKRFNLDNKSNNAYLVVSNKLLVEYTSTSGNSLSSNSIIAIIGELTKQGRLIKIRNEEIKEFQREHFTNKVKKRLASNKEDREHIPVVLLSDRKYALTLDEKFTDDLLNFPSFNATVGKRPSDIPYAK